MNDSSELGTSTRRRLARRVFNAVARNWHDTVYLQQRLIDGQRPWERQGELRWRRQVGGWRIAGSYLPAGPGGCPPSRDRGSLS